MISDTLMSRLRSLTERREEVEHLLGDPDVLGQSGPVSRAQHGTPRADANRGKLCGLHPIA